MIFSEYEKSTGESYPNCPNMKGMGFDEHHSDNIVRQFEKLSKIEVDAKCYKSDVEKWETGFSPECADVHVRVFKGTCVNWDDKWEIWLEWWKWSLVANLKITSDGTIFILKKCQGQSSGNLETTNSNGAARVAAAYDAGSIACKANGDDCVEWSTLSQDELIENYKRNNIKVRGVAEQVGSYEFCSHKFIRSDGKAVSYLCEPERTLFDALTKNRLNADDLDNIVRELWYHPDKQMVKRFIFEASRLM